MIAETLICLQVKSSFYKPGLIVYVSAARIVIDQIGFLKSAVLDLFIRNLRLDLQSPPEPRGPSQGLGQLSSVTGRTGDHGIYADRCIITQNTNILNSGGVRQAGKKR